MAKSFFGIGSLPLAANNVLGDLSSKAGELATRVKDTFDNATGDFKKLALSAPSLDETSANQAFNRSALAAAAPAGTQTSEIDELIREMSPSPWEGHDVDIALADLAADSALMTDRVSAGTVNSLKGQAENDISHMVRLTERGVTQVKFRVMPEVVESRTVEYEAVAPPQFPGAFQKYKGTSSTQWTINATFVCRTTDEATENLKILNILRGWTMPFFGTKTLESFPDKLGAPPPVLLLEGWRAQMVGPVPVVLTSLNWNFPQDVDYIPAREFKPISGMPGNYRLTGQFIPFPTVIKVSIQLVESFSTEQMNGFDIADFRAGHMIDAFKSKQRQTAKAQTAVPSVEAQTAPPGGAFRGLRSDYDPARRVYSGIGTAGGIGSGGGRGTVYPPLVIPKDTVTEATNAAPAPLGQPLTDKFVSGGGGDFAGAGAGTLGEPDW